MLLRSALLATCLFSVGLAGCAISAPNSDMGSDPSQQDGAHLDNEGADNISVLPNHMAELSVRYYDAYGSPVPGVAVEFAFIDAAPGSSLMPTTPVTDDDGRVRSTLSVGSEPVDMFRVRVSADGVDPIYIHVKVSEVATVSVDVEVTYGGERDVNTRTVTALPSVTCEEALAAGVSGELTYTYPEAQTVKRFELGPGLHYAVVAWGKDQTNAKVAEGCTELDAPILGVTKPVSKRVELLDTTMKLLGSFDLTLDLDVSASVERASGIISTVASAALPATDYPEGDYYLDALEAQLRDAGETSAADDLAARSAELAGPLQTSLETAQQGALAYAAALGESCAAFGDRLEVRTKFGSAVDANTIMVSMLRARTSDGVDGIPLELAPEGTWPVDAAYSDTLGAVNINLLTLPVGLGSYVKALISGLAERPEPGPRAQGGCAALAAFIAGDEALNTACDADCAAAACTRALDAVDSASASALTALDTTYASIGLRGQVYAHERTGDGVVDDLGPNRGEFEGSWGNAPDDDNVACTVPVPVTSNLKQ
jgi:hypothetical protein